MMLTEYMLMMHERSKRFWNKYRESADSGIKDNYIFHDI